MKVLIFGLFILFAPLTKAGDCDYTMGISNATIDVLEYSQVITQMLTVARPNSSPSNRCSNYRIYFSRGLSNNYQRKAYTLLGLSSLNYNLHSNINQMGILKDFGDAVTANEYISGTAPNRNTTYPARLYVSIPGLASNIIRSGTYYDVVQARIYGYNENSGNYTFDEADNFTIFFTVAKNIQVSLVDEGSNFDPNASSKIIDFGYLTQGQEKGVDLRVLSNSSYQVRILSQNSGRLRQASTNEFIAYALRVNGVAVNLMAPGYTQIGSGEATSTAGDLYNFKIKINEVTDNKAAGMYQDVITIVTTVN